VSIEIRITGVFEEREKPRRQPAAPARATSSAIDAAARRRRIDPAPWDGTAPRRGIRELLFIGGTGV
jgi:hypothetical protein